jgi:YesN/AraC family two-component response regulator
LKSVSIDFKSMNPALRAAMNPSLLDELNPDQLVDVILGMIDSARSATTKMGTKLDIESVVAYVDSHYTKDLYLAGLAETFKVNEKYLSQRFREFAGTAFHEYLTDKRCAHARKLLEVTDLPIREISAQSGFQNQATFFRVFKKQTGIAATDFRRHARAADQS